MIIYIMNILHNSVNLAFNHQEISLIGHTLMNDARYISSFARIKKNNDISEINMKLANFFELIKKYKISLKDTFDIFEKVIGNQNNKWIINEVYNYNGRYNINEIHISRYLSEIIYSSGDQNNIDELYKNSPNMQRVILDAVFNKIKENNRNNIIENLCDVC